MSTADAWTYPANDGAPRPDDGWSDRARYGLADFITLLWKERFLMATIFVAIAALGIAYAMTLKTTYTAYTSVIASIGQEYVYQPRAGDAGRGAIPDTDSIVATEEAILRSEPLRRRALERIGISNIYPDIDAANPGQAMSKAVRAMDKSFFIDTAPTLPTINLAFEHENPEMAARALNVLMEEYQRYRREVLIGSNTPALQAERMRVQGELAEADDALRAFMDFNNVGDFEAARSALSETLIGLEQQRYTTSASLREKRARLNELTSALASTEREQTIYRDENVAARQELDQARQERAVLLSTYLEDSIPVQEIDQRIAALERSLAALPATGDTARRVGPNPTWQALDAERATVSADVASLTAQLDAITDQVAQVTERQQELAVLAPRYQQLSQERDILQENVRQFAAREQESMANQALAESVNDNVRVVSPATAPSQGSSQRKIVAMLALAFAAMTAAAIGLLRVFMRPGLPTADSAGRTLDLPVLATARTRR